MDKMMPKIIGITQLNTKGQVVIPKEAREAVGLKSNDRVIVVLPSFPNALILIKPTDLEKHMGMIMKQFNEIEKMSK